MQLYQHYIIMVIETVTKYFYNFAGFHSDFNRGLDIQDVTGLHLKPVIRRFESYSTNVSQSRVTNIFCAYKYVSINKELITINIMQIKPNLKCKIL